ncbi:hypothetical protein ACFODL_00100 [Phenylobacterium terrae]|uniref:Uncharacterized protein n=1 Tax=Phenylobacterium terrae TaxID=2665495 RepID=A0ABW4MY73_9CAUL
MVDISDFIEDGGDDGEDGGEAEDLVALKACLRALADAIASTNLAVIAGGQGDAQAATQRVHASVAALKRFHESFQVLDKPEGDEEEAEED